MHLIQKSMSGKIVESKNGRYIYSETFDENSHPKYRNKSAWKSVREYLDSLGDAGVTTLYSDGITKGRAGRSAKPYEIGNVPPIMLSWQCTQPASPVLGDIFVCGKMYKGDMNMGGKEAHSALNSADAAATGAYGTYAVGSDGITVGAATTVAKFLAATDWDAAATALIGHTVALGYAYVPTTDVYVCCTNSVGYFVAGGTFAGHLLLLR